MNTDTGRPSPFPACSGMLLAHSMRPNELAPARWAGITVRVAVSLVAAILAAGCGTEATRPLPAGTVTELSRGWEFVLVESEQTPGDAPRPPASAAWRPLPHLARSQLDGRHDAWLRIALPPVESDSHLFIRGTASRFKVLLEAQPVYRFADPGHSGRVPFWLHVVAIPPGPSGRYLYVWAPNARYGSLRLDQALLAPRAAFALVSRRYLDRAASELDVLFLAPILIGVGLFTGIFALLRSRRLRDLTLLSFGCFSFLYGIRLYLSATTVGQALEPAAGTAWPYVEPLITYVIPIPLAVFLWHFVTGKWRMLALVAVVVTLLFGVVGSIVDLSAGPGTAMLANHIVVMGLGVMILPGVMAGTRRPSSAMLALRAGLLIFLVFALNENLVALGLLPWRWTREPLGFFVFVCCLGYAAAQRFFENERQLAVIAGELEAARRIQRSILPREIPRVPGLDIAVRYLPMTAVAGDYYDFVCSPNGLGVLIADVSGHGVPAALIASMLKVAFASEQELIGDPAALLSKLNRAFSGQLDGQFITAACVFLEPGRGRLIYANAGHPPIAMRKADGTVGALSESGLILGPFAAACYTNSGSAIEPGDRLVLYTDGFIEASGPQGEAFGERRLGSLIESQSALPAGEFADALCRAVSAWSQSGGVAEQEDDLTLIVIDRLGAGECVP